MPTKPAHPAAPIKARVLLVDDHPFLREGIAQHISQQPDLCVCGQAGNAVEALQAVSRLHPDLAIVDLTLPGRDGLELIKDLKVLHPHCRIVVLSMHEESLYGQRVLRAVAQGYIMKRESPAVFLSAIRRVLAGKLVVGQSTLERVLTQMVRQPGAPWATPLDQLSDRELEIFRLIGEGRQRRDIAARLRISVKTYETHRTRIRKKLGLNNAAEVSQHAVIFLQEENR